MKFQVYSSEINNISDILIDPNVIVSMAYIQG